MNPLPNPYDNDTACAVRDILADNGITYHAVLTKYDSERDGWRCDSWLLMLSRGGKSASFEYHTGTGHRRKSKKYPYYDTPVIPSEAALLHSVMLDADAAHDTFVDFCYECGYDHDSRKALDLYLACQQNGIKLRSVIPTDLRAKISGLLADY